MNALRLVSDSWISRPGRGIGAQHHGNPYAERLVGSIRRECLDHTLVLNERHLKRVLTDYFGYYHRWRTHRALEMDSPEGRETQAVERGRVVEIGEVGGLHHHYERIAA